MCVVAEAPGPQHAVDTWKWTLRAGPVPGALKELPFAAREESRQDAARVARGRPVLRVPESVPALCRGAGGHAIYERLHGRLLPPWYPPRPHPRECGRHLQLHLRRERLPARRLAPAASPLQPRVPRLRLGRGTRLAPERLHLPLLPTGNQRRTERHRAPARC